MKSIKSLVAILMSIAVSCGNSQTLVKKGDLAPNFELEDAFGKKYSLSDYKGKNYVVLYFYPKASTPGCTKQACNIRDNFEVLKEKDIVVFGISVDSKESLKKFIENEKLNFTLLSDENKSASKSYGVLNALGFSNRVTFIIDKEGKIFDIIDKVDVSNHSNQILESIKNGSL